MNVIFLLNDIYGNNEKRLTEKLMAFIYLMEKYVLFLNILNINLNIHLEL